ncbi:MAG: hypothetical protein KAR47_11570 [Planctomycetes bacterium]|nr:hypothetical protein [Planctomycetota bacterium]
MGFLAQLITWINVPINAVAQLLLAPVAFLPGWLSNTIISGVTGVIMLVIFKYTSNQKAIGKVRDNIKANMLALKLFKDSISVTLQAQRRMFGGAFLLLFHAIRPMLVMIVPVSLLLAQMALWYQFSPLTPGDETVITVQLNSQTDGEMPEVSLNGNVAEVTAGPVRVPSKRQVYWKIRVTENGMHNLVFQAGGEQFEKQLAVGNGFMPISPQRPGWHWGDIMLNPREKPFGPDSLVESISIDYPKRISRTSGTHWWLGYFFVASLIFALIFKPFLKVKI